jgi:hypothetical protein
MLLPYVILFSILASPFSLNHFIDFMTCKMRWRTPLFGVTIELILHTPKLVFHWNVASMSHVHRFRDSLKY